MGRRLISAGNLLSLVLFGIVNLKIASLADETSTVQSSAASVIKTDITTKGTNMFPSNNVSDVCQVKRFHVVKNIEADDKLRMPCGVECKNYDGLEVGWFYSNITPSNASKEVRKNISETEFVMFENGELKTEDENYAYDNDNDTHAITIKKMREQDRGHYRCNIAGKSSYYTVHYSNHADTNHAEQVGGLLMLVATIVKFIVS